MYGTGNKKMLNMLILEILRLYSDENHSLTQQEIIKLLNQNYGMECDRRSVKSNVMSLKEMGYDIATDKGYRLLSREFDDSELRILIDSVLFSKSISTRQAKGLIAKIRGLASNFFNAKVWQMMPIVSIELRKVYRQTDDSFIAILDRIQIFRQYLRHWRTSHICTLFWKATVSEVSSSMLRICKIYI